MCVCVCVSVCVCVCGFPYGSAGKQYTCRVGDTGDAGVTPGLGRSPGEGNGYPLQHSCLENLVDRRAWRATIQRVAKSWTQLRVSTHTCVWACVCVCVCVCVCLCVCVSVSRWEEIESTNPVGISLLSNTHTHTPECNIEQPDPVLGCHHCLPACANDSPQHCTSL